MESRGYDVSCLAIGPGFVRAVVSVAELAVLEAAGHRVTLVEAAQPMWAKLASRSGGGVVPTGYRDLATINADLATLAATYPGLCQVVDAAAEYGPGATFEGRSITVVKISDNVSIDEDEPEVLFVSAHHCREVVTPEIGVSLAEALLSGYGTDPAITAAVDGQEIWIAPVWNPDGYEYVWTTNNLWRKNRKPSGNGNGDVGVDLNRNYPFGWDYTCGGSTNPGSQTYRGIAAGSEEETQTMVGFLRARHFTKMIDFHSFAEQVRRGYPCAAMPTPVDDISLAEAALLAAASSYVVAPSCCLGGDIHQHMAENTAYTFLPETHTSFQPSYVSALTEIQTNLLPLCMTVLARPVPLTGLVTDATSGAPIAASIDVDGVVWQNGERRRAHLPNGRYNQWLPEGAWSVTVDAPGYAPLTRTVNVAANATTVEHFALGPSGAFELELSTYGWGVGDLLIDLHGIPPGTTEGFTLFSFATTQTVGAGNLFGLQPDFYTLQGLLSPPAPTGLFHWVTPFLPGFFPAAPFSLPAGSLETLSGTSVDGVGIALGPAFGFLGATAPVRITF